MNDIIDIFTRVLPRRQLRTGLGWITFQCPACGDKRWPGRGGFKTTETGGFRYTCFNGGCEYQVQPTGWEPGEGLGGRPRRLFEMFGGDIWDIPYRYLLRASSTYDRDKKIADPDEVKPAFDFPTIELPSGSQYLIEAKTRNAKAVLDYIRDRGEHLLSPDSHPLIWSPVYPRSVIIPLIHSTGREKGKIIGWTRRVIDRGPTRYVKCENFPGDYMLNQHTINHRTMSRVVVMESPLDAIAMRTLCTFGAKLTKRMIALLKLTGKDVVLVPDYQKTEWTGYLNAARENDFYMATPQWLGDDGYSAQNHIKDPGEAIKRNGVLSTIESLVGSLTKNYDLAETRLRMFSR